MTKNNVSDKSLESWLWDAACSIRGAQDAAKYEDFILRWCLPSGCAMCLTMKLTGLHVRLGRVLRRLG